MFKEFQEIKSDEYNCWDKLENQHVISVNKYVNNIDINTRSSYKCSVVTDTEIKIHTLNAKDGHKAPSSIGNFKDASCCKFRADGNMIVIGTKCGNILLVSPEHTGKIIKNMSAHKGEISRIEYMHKYDPIQTLSVSIGEDGTMQIWDVLTSQRLHLFANSKEPLRGLAISKADPDIIATGSLDGFIRIYNLSSNPKMILEFDTQVQVNCLIFPFETNTKYVLSAGKSTLSTWNISDLPLDKDDKPVADSIVTPHHMQITDIYAENGLDNSGRVVFTSGLDGMIKVISLLDFSELAKYEYPTSLMSVRVFPNCLCLVASGNNMIDSGKCDIYTRQLVTDRNEKTHQKADFIAEQQKILNLTAKYCDTGESLTVIKHISKAKPKYYTKLLRSHSHRALLNGMLNDRDLEKNPGLFQFLIRELDNLGVLKRTIMNQDEKKLNILFRYMRGLTKSANYIITCLRILELIKQSYPTSVLVNQLEYVKFKKALNLKMKTIRKVEQKAFDVKEVLLSCESTYSHYSRSNEMELDNEINA